ncbi:hypothetical protein Clacol_009716 [Clathrus columnatus]|uniref:type I protein arginine methyltransferase n=1 Tax=Clathrus columnatus TaxID=1419009 RepID=A0AAV5APK2_9AGAM|nr:hypothetical protein Clacol_009716 [Clathrus columnatus]
MSAIHIRGAAPAYSESDSQESSSEDEEENWSDWVSESGRAACKSLFDDEVFSSVDLALKHDKTKYNVDIQELTAKLSLDFHDRVHLINYIRKTKPTPSTVLALTGQETFFSDDQYLRPIIEDDPLLQLHSDDWTDSEDEGGPSTSKIHELSNPKLAARKIKRLEEKLRNAKQNLIDYGKLVENRLELAKLVDEAGSTTIEAPKPRDDDTHYFESYAENDIHAVMIQDKVRTSSYASFILTNPIVFRDAVVLDVGCGTGILSLFAARAGAKKVFAVDASNISERAEKIVKANNLDNVITGKVENISLPNGIDKVDVIISEWMGYALLYESMLDSVLVARDRFLKPDGLMAPSQTRIMFGLSEAKDIYKARVEFWSDIYGYDLSAMAENIYDDAIIDTVDPESLVTNTVCIKDMHLSTITSQSLNFTSSFRLKTNRKISKAYAFILYFDTFFTPTGDPVDDDAEVTLVKDGEPALAEVWQVPGKPRRKESTNFERGKEVSFSTGPMSIPTHWKQTIFLLKEPIKAEDDSIISGTLYCRKREDNSRELDIEIHYCVLEKEGAQPQDMTVQIYKVR